MSDSDPLDLSARDLMQNWVNDLESPQNFVEKKYRDYEDRGGDQRGGGKGKGRGRGGFGGGGGAGRGGFGDRDKGRGGQGGRGGGQGGRGGPGGKGKGGKPWDNKRGGGRDDRRSSGPPRDPAPQFSVAVEPSQETVEALAKHIRTTGRAYSMVDVARMVMASRDRYQVAFQNQVPAPPKKKKAAPKGGADQAAPEAAPQQKQETEAKQKVAQERPMLVRCKLDGSLWLTREEAVRHVLSGPLIEEFYQVDEVEVEAPKGNFSVIAVCGMSGTMLGPPNHHEYQTNLNKLYRERFSNMGFERFKSRIEMKRDEETIEAWKTSVSTAKHYRVKPPEAKKDEAGTVPAESEAASAADAAAVPEAPAEAGETDAATVEEEVVATEVADAATEAEAGSVTEDAAPVAEPETESEATEPEASEDATETAPEESAEDAGADAASLDDGSDAEVEAEPEAAEEPEIVLSSERELEQHFRDNFARRVFREVGGGVVPGNVPARNLSAPLFEKLKRESEFMRRGFPLPLIQTLCRRFEKVGLKFFKRDKKALYVSSARPRSISGESGMTDRIRKVVEHVRVYPNVKVPKLLESVIDGFIAPRNEEEMAGHKPTEEEMSFLRDIRWLTKEGYLIEYSSGELVLGHAEPSRERPAKKKSAPPKAEEAAKAEITGSPANAEKVEPTPSTAPAEESAEAPAADADAEPEVAAEVPAEPKVDAATEPEASVPAVEASGEAAVAPSERADADTAEGVDAEKPTGN